MGKNILVVDDCEDVRVLLSMKLTNMGHHVYEACDGLDALRYIDECHDIDLILMDLIMPNMSGVELLKKIKKRNYDFKIVCISAHFGESDKDYFYNLGALDVIEKPIKNKALEKKLSDSLNST